MVYKRYIKSQGKTYGPYYYISVRKGKKVTGVFLGKTLKQAQITLRKLHRRRQKKRQNAKRGFRIWNFHKLLYLLLVLFIFISASGEVVKASEGAFIELNTIGSVYEHELIWKEPYTGTWDEFGSVVIENGIGYVVGKGPEGTQNITAFNATNGGLIWTTHIGDSDGTPLIDNQGDYIYINAYTSGGVNGIYKLNKTTGSILCENHTCSARTLQSMVQSDDLIFDGSYSDKIYAYNKDDCSVNWSYTVPGATNVPTTPLYWEDTVTFGTDGGSYHFVQLNATTGEHIWNSTVLGSTWDMQPSVKDGIIYMASFSSLTGIGAFNFTTGELIWSRTGIGQFLSQMAIYDNRVWAGGGNNRIYSLNLVDGTTNCSSYNTVENIFQGPAIVPGLAFFGSVGGTINMINTTDCSLIWSYDIGASVFSPPAIAKGTGYFATDDYNVYAFDFGSGTGEWSYIGYNSSGQSFCSDCLTEWQYIKASCSPNVNNITCNVTSYYDHDVPNVTLNVESLKFDWYNSSGGLLESDSVNYTIPELKSSETKTFALVPTGEIMECANIVISGAYYLTSNIANSASTCFPITSSNVELDCQGYTVDGTDTFNIYGIYVKGTSGSELTNVTIKNCPVNDFGEGVYFEYTNNSFIYNSSATSAFYDGFYIRYSDYNTFSNLTQDSTLNGGFSLEYSYHNTFSDVRANSNGQGFKLSNSDYNAFYNITATGQSASGKKGVHLGTSDYNNFTEGVIKNNYDGIYTTGYSHHNRFSGLNITDNSNYGIYFAGSSDSYNYVYNNYFNNTINAYWVSSVDSYWSITKTAGTNIMGGSWIGGNYWAYPNGTGFSETCTDADGDGICDSPYDMGAGEIDSLPLFVDTTPPTVTLNLPADDTNQSSTTVNFNCSATDNNYLKNITLYGNWSGGWHANETKNITGTSNETTFTKTLTDGSYIWNCLASDSGGNTAFNESNRTINVDAIKPVITLISITNNTGDSDGNVTFNYNVTDASAVSNCSLILNCVINQTNSSITKDTIQNFTLNNLASGGYSWSINCTDSFSNAGASENRTFAVVLSTNFAGDTTDFNQVNISNITNLIIDQPNYGKVNFSQEVDLSSGADINTYVNISDNKIEVNSTALPALNKSSTLYLYNLTYNNPRILRDGAACPSTICTRISYSGGTLKFNVTSFTSYSVEDYCGNGYCESGESCSSCSADCGTCPSEGGGGGGGAVVVSHKLSIGGIKTINTKVSKSFKVEVKIGNTGDYSETNITISIEDCPKNWDCGYASVSELRQGGNTTANLDIKVAEDAEIKIYNLYMVAQNSYLKTKRSFDIIVTPLCSTDTACEENEKCISNKCEKLFDVKILRADSPIPPGEVLDFAYLMKGVVGIDGDVIVEFWLEKNGKNATSGSDTIYLGSFEEKTETASIFLPTTAAIGTYDFYVQLNYGKYKTKAHRSIQVGYEVPLILDMELSELPAIKSGGMFEFSATFSFNKDTPSPLHLEEKIKRGDKVVWSRERDLEIKRSATITEDVGELKAGNYQLELIGYYGDKTSKVSRSFSVEATAEDYKRYVIPALVGLATFIFCFVLYWERKKIKAGIIKEEKWIKRHKVSIAVLGIFAIAGFTTYYLNKTGIISLPSLKEFFANAFALFKSNILPYLSPQSKYFYYVIGSIIAVIILITLIILCKKKRGKKEGLKKLEKADLETVKDYIEKAKSMGFADEQIKAELAKSGWQPSLVKEAFKEVEKEKRKKAKAEKARPREEKKRAKLRIKEAKKRAKLEKKEAKARLRKERKKEKEEQKRLKKAGFEKAKDYIQKTKSKGFSDKQIKAELARRGWQPWLIKKALSEVARKKKKAERRKIKLKEKIKRRFESVIKKATEKKEKELDRKHKEQIERAKEEAPKQRKKEKLREKIRKRFERVVEREEKKRAKSRKK